MIVSKVIFFVQFTSSVIYSLFGLEKVMKKNYNEHCKYSLQNKLNK